MKRANYRAPRGHREALIVPDTERLPAVTRANAALLASYDFEILRRPVQEVRGGARRRLLALPYECLFGNAPSEGEIRSDAPIILTGHQPELYHPGVWLKNFLAGHLAAAVGGTAVNLNVDNDESHQLTLRAPVRDGESVRVVETPYLEPTGGLPYEELDGSLLLDGAAERLREQGVDQSLCRAAAQYWKRLDAARARGALGKVIACARHQLERDEGLENKEVQVSDVACMSEFRLVVLDILSRLEAFHAAYNEALATFRRVHHEKNPAQPVPNLAREGDRWEMPFWVWRRGCRRERLWVSFADGGRRLFIDGEKRPFAEIEGKALAGGGAAAIAQLEEQESRGIRIRPRALTLTLFARVFLGDVFIHGLGGAMYDKVTDELVREYYGVEPPQLVMATGTALLPLKGYDAGPEDRRRLERRLRDIRHNPDRLMAPAERDRKKARELADCRRRLIEDRRATKAERDAAWRELHEVNRRLAEMLDCEPDATRRQLREVEDKLARNALLRDREYTFVLHPRDELVRFYNDVTRVPSGVES